MATVAELSAPFAEFMLAPRRGPDVCDICFNFTAGYRRCYRCTRSEPWLDAVVPVSYSVGDEALYQALKTYKRCDHAGAEGFAAGLAAVLWRFLKVHEPCAVRQAGIDGFSLVTTVPSSDRRRDPGHPLRRIVGELLVPTRDRHRRVLVRSDAQVSRHQFDRAKYESTTRLEGETVLLIDDTWTTGANAQSAAAALKLAGARNVVAVVIGRHLNREWRENDRRLRGITLPFDWSGCALCASPVPSTGDPDTRG